MIFFQSTIEKSLYLLLLLTFTMGTVIGYNAIQQSKHNHEILVNNCNVGNEFRRDNKNLWNYILNLTPEQPPTPEQQKRVKDFREFLDKTFMERDCSQI